MKLSAPRLLPRLLLATGVIAVGVSFSSNRATALGEPSLFLDAFEYANIPIISPQYSSLLWNQYEADPTEGPDPGVESTTTEARYAGTRSLKVRVTGGNLYLQFFPHDGNRWKNMREFIPGWTLNNYNRMRLWVRLPSQARMLGGGQSSMYIGTYFRRRSETTDAEAGGGHFYHAYDLGYADGSWEQLILDPHPDTVRGATGGAEQGVRLYPTNDSGYNYFDAMTRFYLDFVGRLSSTPADFYLDGVELYKETRDENLEQVYGLHGVYVPGTNTVRVGWKRNKDENSVRHEVRYSFTDIFVSGWSAAAAAPGGTITPPGWQGYNGMAWSSNSLSLSGRTVLYVGIKPENSSRFRQIAIPLIAGGDPTTTPAPTAPANVRVIR